MQLIISGTVTLNTGEEYIVPAFSTVVMSFRENGIEFWLISWDYPLMLGQQAFILLSGVSAIVSVVYYFT